MHATRFGDEDALVLGQRRLLAQDVFEHARARAIGMLGLGHLTQLQRVTEQDQILRTVRRRDGVSERQLTGLVDDEYVDGERTQLWSGP